MVARHLSPPTNQRPRLPCGGQWQRQLTPTPLCLQGGSMPQQPPQVSQGIDCATAVGQGNGFNNCTNVLQPGK